MARSLRWKATVALNILLCFLLIDAFAQSNSIKTITYTCRAQRLESVIEYLSKNSGYDFIYSRDLVDVSRPVSLTVKDKSINEVLTLIEKQVNVSFRIKDHHVILKSVSNIPKAPAATKPIPVVPTFESTDSLLITSISKNIPVAPVESHAKMLQVHLDKKISEVQKLLGSRVPRNIPNIYLSQINFNNRYRSWFASVGTHFGDNHTGLELQAGLNYLYAVVQPRWTPGEGFCPAYGAGNSFNLVGNFSFNTIYLYSIKNRTEVSYPFANPILGTGPAVTRINSVRQHQIKMLVQYSFSNNFSVRIGPVLNYRTELNDVGITNTNATPEVNTSYGFASPAVRTVHVNRASKSRFFESWIGWDAAVQYRINFHNRK